MRFITKVTVTGADDTNSPQDLLDVADEFPFVEFGILLSRRSMGSPRFPSREWLSSMVDKLAGGTVHLSGHICGGWVREILMGNWPGVELHNPISGIHTRLERAFERFQLNTHAEPHDHDPKRLQKIINDLGDGLYRPGGQKVIIQNDNVNVGLLSLRGIQTLFDLSHGAGVLPSEWPRPMKGIECGYAGGLSPANVVAQIRAIEPLVGDRQIWIDAETHLRTRSDEDRFDMDKVRAFLRAAEPYVLDPQPQT